MRTGRRRGTPSRLVALLAALAASACAGAGAERASVSGTPPATGKGDRLVPPGYGTLRQDDVSLSFRSGELQVKVTPLAESVIRLTAPDTYRRLHGIAEGHREALSRQTGLAAPVLFLVSFFSLAPDVSYEAEGLAIVSRGVRHRALAIRPVTPGWGAQRLDQRETRLAVYAFDEGVELETAMTVEYRGVRNDAWARILTDLQAERERVRARAGIS